MVQFFLFGPKKKSSILRLNNIYTPRSLTVETTQKWMVGWKMILSFWGPAYFQGRAVELPGST